jgi:hypothetical protein
MSTPIPAACSVIAAELEQIESALRFLQEELQTASPSLKPVIIREIARTQSERAAKRRELRNCQSANLPDLVARTVTIQVNHTEKTICVAGIIRNIGKADASGPFKVAIGITVRKNGVLISSQTIFEVPESVTIEADGGELTTECAQQELIYRDEHPDAVYELEFLVDVEHIVKEFKEGNNHIRLTWWTISPSTVKRPLPIKIESRSSVDPNLSS